MQVLRNWIRGILERELLKAIEEIKEKTPQISIPLRVEVVKPSPGPAVSPIQGAEPLLTRGYYWSDSNQHWYLLKEFLSPVCIESFDENRVYLERGLQEPFSSAIRTFVRNGLLEQVQMQPCDWLVFLFQKKSLLGMCAELGVEEAYGTKDDLSLLLWEYDREYVKKKIKTAPYYQLTESGIRAAAARFNNKILLERVRRMDAGEE